LEDIVRRSGVMVRDTADFTVKDKGTKENVVTSVDVENEIFLKRELLSLIPGSVFKGEEGDDVPVAQKGYTWIVDPIDGTTNFARRIPEIGISVGLLKDGEPFMGVVYNPYTDNLYSAERGKGARKNGVPIRVSDRPMEDCLLCTAWCAYYKQYASGCFRVSERMHPICNDIRRIGTAAIELSMLAEGAVDLFFEIRLCPWDYAAASVILSEAGGFMVSMEGPVDYDHACAFIAANNEGNLETLAKIVREEFGGKTPYDF
jgi:myo-inositol-1(or 4)-monophosphatase